MTTAVAAPAIDRQDSLDSSLDEVIEMTREFFSGPISTEVMFDPEFPSDRWTVIDVEASGSSKELVELSCQWHERLARQFPELVSYIRLSIYPVT